MSKEKSRKFYKGLDIYMHVRAILVLQTYA